MVNIFMNMKRTAQNEQYHKHAPDRDSHPEAPETASRRGLSGFVIGVLGAKGGVGNSTLALNLATSLAQNHNKTILIDGNLQQPDIALMLGKQPEYSVLDLLRYEEISPEVLEACSLRVSDAVPNCSLVSPPSTGDAVVKTHLSQITQAMLSVKDAADYWVIDLPNHLDKHLVTTLDSCDCIVLVFEETITSITAVRRWLNNFDKLGYSVQKTLLVLNRAGSKSNGNAAGIDQLLSTHELLRIPNAFTLSERCLTSGEPAVLSHPKDKYSSALKTLANIVKAHVGADSHD